MATRKKKGSIIVYTVFFRHFQENKTNAANFTITKRRKEKFKITPC